MLAVLLLRPPYQCSCVYNVELFMYVWLLKLLVITLCIFSVNKEVKKIIKKDS